MTRTSRNLLIALVILVVAAIAVIYVQRTTIVLDAPEPTVIPETVDSLPQLPFSMLEAPVTYDLGTAVDSIEAAVPLDYGNLDHRIPLHQIVRAVRDGPRRRPRNLERLPVIHRQLPS